MSQDIAKEDEGEAGEEEDGHSMSYSGNMQTLF